MGSLMAGWSSPVRDPRSINIKRNRSMTKEEIANYWKSEKNKEEVHGVLKPSRTFSKGDQVENLKEIEKMYKRSNSLPTTKENSILATLEEGEEDNKEKLFKKHGWWQKSGWAFLNEPPVIASETPFRYAAQFHVAQKQVKDSDYPAAANGIRT